MLVALGVVPILTAGGIGWLTLRALGGGRFGTQRWYMAYPIGAGLMTFGLFLLSWIGLPLTLTTTAILTVTLIIVLMFLRVPHLPRVAGNGAAGPGRPSAHKPSLRMGILVGAVGFLAIAAAAISVGRSYASWDGMAIWSVKGYGIAREATIEAASEWGSHGLTYPLNVPLQVTVFYMLDGDYLPHSKLIYPAYFLSLTGGLLSFLRRRHSMVVAGIAALLIMTSPILFDHATNGYANLAFSAYLVLGLLALTEASHDPAPPLEVAAGLMLGLATWTRPEGLYFVLASALSVLLAFRLTPSKRAPSLLWGLPILLLALPWIVFSVLGGYQENAGEAFRNAWSSWMNLDFHLADLKQILRYLGWQAVRPEFWGVSMWALAAASLVMAKGIRFQVNRLQIPILAAAASIFLAVVGYYYLEAFRSDLTYLLSTSVERVAMPGMVLALAWLSDLLPAVPTALPDGS